MRHHAQLLIHGLSWLHQAKQQGPSVHHKRVLSVLSLVSKYAHQNRKLDDYGDMMMGGGDYGDMMGGGDYGDMMGGGNILPDEVMEEFQECGVDLESIMDEVLLGAMMGGGGVPEGEGTDDVLSTMMGGFGSPSDILDSLAEDGEVECTDDQEAELEDALYSFNTCTGFDQISLDGMDDIFEIISEKCNAATDAATSVAMGEEDVDMDAMNECIDEVLGHNAIGDFARDVYHHPYKICDCVAELEDAVPTCLLTISVPDDAVPEEMEEFFPEGMEDLKIPLSLLKKAACLVGIPCDAIDEWCETELEALDHCLPAADESSFSCLSVIEKCALEEDPPVSITAPPMLTTSELPDACQNVYEESPTTNIIERYRNFNAVCNSNVVDNSDTAKTPEDEEDWSSSSSESSSDSDSSSSSDESPSPEDSSTTSSVAASATKETEEEDEGVNTNAIAVPVVAVAVVLGLIAAFFIVKRRRSRVDTTFPSRNNFSHVGTGDEFDEALGFETGNMA